MFLKSAASFDALTGQSRETMEIPAKQFSEYGRFSSINLDDIRITSDHVTLTWDKVGCELTVTGSCVVSSEVK